MMQVEAKYAHPEHDKYLYDSIVAFSNAMRNGDYIPEAYPEEVIQKISILFAMNNAMSRFSRTARARAVTLSWMGIYQSHLIQRKKFGCIDGRDSAAFSTISFGFPPMDDLVENVEEDEAWQVPAGIIALKDQSQGNRLLEPWEALEADPRNLILASPDLVIRQQARNAKGQEVFVNATVHAKNKQIMKGCLAWDNFIASKLTEPLTKPPVLANAEAAERLTLGRFLIAHNAHKDRTLIPLSRAGIVSILYTDNYDRVYRNGDNELSTRELVLEYRDVFVQEFGEGARYGQFTEHFAGSGHLGLDTELLMNERALFYVKNILENLRFKGLNDKLESFLTKRGNGRFSRLQALNAKLDILRDMWFWHEVDFDQIEGNHYLSEHREEAVGISERGNPPLQRHPLQTLSLVPANYKKNVIYSELAGGVMHEAQNSGPPYIFLLANNVPDHNMHYESPMDLTDPSVWIAASNNFTTFERWSVLFMPQILSGEYAAIPIAKGEKSKLIKGIFNHAYQAPKLTRIS